VIIVPSSLDKAKYSKPAYRPADEHNLLLQAAAATGNDYYRDARWLEAHPRYFSFSDLRIQTFSKFYQDLAV
jgi:hypothetical protein